MELNELFLPYDLSLELKEIGFNEPCLRWYNGHMPEYQESGYAKNSESWLDGIHCSAPTWEQALIWFDTNYKIRIDLIHADSNGSYKYCLWKWNYDNNVGKWERIGHIGTYDGWVKRNYSAVKDGIKLYKDRILQDKK